MSANAAQWVTPAALDARYIWSETGLNGQRLHTRAGNLRWPRGRPPPPRVPPGCCRHLVMHPPDERGHDMLPHALGFPSRLPAFHQAPRTGSRQLVSQASHAAGLQAASRCHEMSVCWVAGSSSGAVLGDAHSRGETCRSPGVLAQPWALSSIQHGCTACSNPALCRV